ncbi:MAG: hypothetical protein QM803_18385 [Rhodocyclaceae bacterium]
MQISFIDDRCVVPADFFRLSHRGGNPGGKTGANQPVTIMIVFVVMIVVDATTPARVAQAGVGQKCSRPVIM